ncbi:alpha/beta hydrolase [Pseudogemmobacter sonorensis]|uniref:alpha/beta hydrolase n=1 Tax=Pseudogemmobacter sonorensis TaxID=2989681 RepID=UPI0036833D0F
MRAALIPAVLIAAALAALLAFAPRPGVDRQIAFDDSVLGDDPEVWLEVSEQQYADLRPGAAKRIQWAGARGAKTPLSVVYIHGFSASAEEIRPVPDEVAKALGANLYYTRLAGHGRPPEALARVEAGDWVEDMAEAMAIGRRIGGQVIVIASSMGGALAAIAATDPELSRDMAGLVLVSPALDLRAPLGTLLDLPLASSWAPFLLGRHREVAPVNADHARYWTTRIPTAALFPLAALMREARAQDYTRAGMPLLVILSPDDRVISPEAAAEVTAHWGGPLRIEERRMTAGDDALAHVIAGDVFSPGQTEAVIALILDWARNDWARSDGARGDRSRNDGTQNNGAQNNGGRP